MIRRMSSVWLCAALLAGAAAAGDGVTFVYKFDPGSSQRYRLKINSEMDMMGMAMSQMADMEVTIKCVSAKDGKHAMSMTFDKVEASKLVAGNMQTDTSAPRMIGKSVNFTVDSQGEVSEIAPAAGFDAWTEVSQIVEPTLKSWYVYMPGTAQAVGSEWKHENFRETSASGAEYVSNEHFKFKSAAKEKGRDRATVEENIETTVGGSSQSPMGTYKLSGAGKGKFEFVYDVASCTVVRLKGTMDLDIDMTPESGGDPVKTSVSNHLEREILE